MTEKRAMEKTRKGRPFSTVKRIIDRLKGVLGQLPIDNNKGESGLVASGRPFSQFGLPEEVLKGLKDVGYERCTPIQELCLPISLGGRDVAGQAQTGTGKTAAFLITVFHRLLTSPIKGNRYPSAIIIAPTRELVLQIGKEARALGAHTGLRITEVFGGLDHKRQRRLLGEGTDIVIGTPGRLIDYIKSRDLRLKDVQVVVVDEADRMFDMGFVRDLRYILRRLPPYDKRQSLLFSATLSPRVLELAYEHMNAPEEIAVEPQVRTVNTLEQCVFHVGMDQKLPLLLGLLKREQWSRVLIFCNTRDEVDRLSRRLRANGHPAQGISGRLPQQKRIQLMERFKSGDLKILVATDVASRGLHIEDVSHVINYDLPQDKEDYVHRIGRTARLGKAGKAISLACEKWVWHLEEIEDYIGMKIPVVWFNDDWLEPVVPTKRRNRHSRRVPSKRVKGSPDRRQERSVSGHMASGPKTSPKSIR